MHGGVEKGVGMKGRREGESKEEKKERQKVKLTWRKKRQGRPSDCRPMVVILTQFYVKKMVAKTLTGWPLTHCCYSSLQGRAEGHRNTMNAASKQ